MQNTIKTSTTRTLKVKNVSQNKAKVIDISKHYNNSTKTLNDWMQKDYKKYNYMPEPCTFYIGNEEVKVTDILKDKNINEKSLFQVYNYIRYVVSYINGKLIYFTEQQSKNEHARLSRNDIFADVFHNSQQQECSFEEGYDDPTTVSLKNDDSSEVRQSVKLKEPNNGKIKIVFNRNVLNKFTFETKTANINSVQYQLLNEKVIVTSHTDRIVLRTAMEYVHILLTDAFVACCRFNNIPVPSTINLHNCYVENLYNGEMAVVKLDGEFANKDVLNCGTDTKSIKNSDFKSALSISLCLPLLVKYLNTPQDGLASTKINYPSELDSDSPNNINILKLINTLGEDNPRGSNMMKGNCMNSTLMNLRIDEKDTNVFKNIAFAKDNNDINIKLLIAADHLVSHYIAQLTTGSCDYINHSDFNRGTYYPKYINLHSHFTITTNFYKSPEWRESSFCCRPSDDSSNINLMQRTDVIIKKNRDRIDSALNNINPINSFNDIYRDTLQNMTRNMNNYNQFHSRIFGIIEPEASLSRLEVVVPANTTGTEPESNTDRNEEQ